MSAEPALAAELERAALEQGFVLSGVVDIEPTLAEPADIVGSYAYQYSLYQHWLDRQRQGTMHYLARGAARRADPRHVFAPARSVWVVALPYPALPLGSTSVSRGPRFARYLRGQDYHQSIPERLERALTAINRERSLRGVPVIGAKFCTDTSALLERAWAVQAGLGWIGKNSMLIHPRLGSYFLLGEALLDIASGRGPTRMADRCGHCERCLDGCPTRAIEQDRTLDARRCISAQTLEFRGERDAITRATLPSRGPWVAGCDVCQEVCPFNQRATRTAQKQGAASDDAWDRSWEEWASLDAQSYAEWVEDSALSRIRYADFVRNQAEALGAAIGRGSGSPGSDSRNVD